MAVLTFAAFVALSVRKPWGWGRQDCTIWVADWVIARRGIDPAMSFRDRYASAAEAEALIADAGDLIALVRPQMGFAAEVTGPVDGDVGIILIDGRQTAAIRDGNKWAFRTGAGIGFVECDALISWGM